MAKLLSVTVKIKNALIQSFCNSFIYHICKPMILTSFDTTSETHGHCGPRQPCLQIWWPQISNRNQIRQIFFHSKCLNLLRHQLVKKKFGNMCLVSIFYITLCTKICEGFTYFSSEMAVLYQWQSGRYIICMLWPVPAYLVIKFMFVINATAVPDLVFRSAWVEVIYF